MSLHVTRKRKRPGYTDPIKAQPVTSLTSEQQIKLLNPKVHHAVKLLARGLKIAKTFETQKLHKRINGDR